MQVTGSPKSEGIGLRSRDRKRGLGTSRTAEVMRWKGLRERGRRKLTRITVAGSTCEEGMVSPIGGEGKDGRRKSSAGCWGEDLKVNKLRHRSEGAGEGSMRRVSGDRLKTKKREEDSSYKVIQVGQIHLKCHRA